MFDFLKNLKSKLEKKTDATHADTADSIGISVRGNNYFVVDLSSLINSPKVKEQVRSAQNI